MAELRKIKASTLIETIVAMVIIVMVTGITFTILANLSGQHNPTLKSQAYIEAVNTISSMQELGDLREGYEEVKTESFVIMKTIQKYRDSEGILLIEVSVRGNSGTVLARLRKLRKI